MSNDLRAALQRKLDWIEVERQKHLGVKTTTELLKKKSELKTEDCMRRIVRLEEEIPKAYRKIEDMARRLANGQAETVRQFAELRQQAIVAIPVVLQETALAQVKVSNDVFATLNNMSALLTMSYEFLLLELEALVEENDNAPVEAFANELRKGGVDFLFGVLLSFIPGGQAVLTAAHAIEAAITARATRSKETHDYILEIETYNEACDKWD
jgi:hypothetical protein